MLHRSMLAIALATALLGLCAPAGAKDFLYVPGANYLSIVDCDTDSVVKTLQYNDYVIGCSPSFDAKYFFINGWRNIYVVDTKTDTIVDTLTFWSELSRVNVVCNPAPSPDGNSLYMIWSVVKKKLNVPRLTVPPWQFVIYDLKKKQVTKSFDVPWNTTAIIPIENDPEHVILMSQDVLKFNVKTGQYTKIKGQLYPEEGQPMLNNLIIWVNWAPTSDSGVFPSPAYGSDGSLQYMLIDRKNGSLKLTKAEDIPALYSCILSPDAKFLFGCMDEVVKVDLSNGKVVAKALAPRGTTYAEALTSDGKKLYTGPSGNDIMVWDTATLKYLGFIPLKHDGIVMSRISK